ncbi:MAG TPA: thiamine pyrophosphate-dependent enzyme [Dehalococcoidia bacterium]|nr:thiamine pyrophosphate-dependent enzyme [Dehalococcoidia bacterium]
MTGGQALVQQLKMEGIDTIFGLPGIQLDWAFDAIYEERDHFNVYWTRHEQATAYMADGYARTTGKVGMCLVVPGPGLLNASAALATAYACSSPVLCVTGQINSDMIGLRRGILHEINNQMETIASVTKWQARAMRPEEVPGIVHEAFKQLQTGRPRPVEIEIPPDVLQATGEVRLFEPEFHDRPAGDPDLIERAAQALGRAKNPVIFSGGGIISGAAWEELQRLAELLEAPVIMTNNGKGALSDRHHLAHNARSTPSLAPAADVVLVVGTRFVQGIMQNQPPPWLTRDKTVIQMDVDPEEVGRNYKPDIGIVADAKKGLAALAERVGRHNIRRPSRRDELMALKKAIADEARAMSPQADYAWAIRDELPDDGIFIQESTQVGYWSGAFFPAYQPRTYFTSGYQGTLGYGFATALGAQVGNPDRKVVSINGDGGFFYNVQELSTMVQQKIPLTAIVFNDNAYGNVKRIQEMRFGGRTIASDLYNPDMAKLADAYGVDFRRANSPAELRSVLHDVFKDHHPVLIECPVGPMPQMQFGQRPPQAGQQR